MTVLLGPADADHFRVKVGRFGDRWYTDPLPTCPIAEASDWQGPSVSATKPPFANKYVPIRAIADMPSDEWARLAKKDADARYEACKTHDKHVGQVNMSRGGIVHKMAENRLLGRPVETHEWGQTEAEEQAQKFLPALDAFFDTHQPTLLAAEVVCLHRTLNGVGYGGTADAIIEVEDDPWLVDWKSRNSDHAAYPDDAGQGGAYIGAEYMIIQGPDGNPARAHLPDVAGVLIVSIREDGYRVYPIDAAGAIKHYEAMHAWWVAQQDLTAQKVIGRPWAPKNVSAGLVHSGAEQAGELSGGSSPLNVELAGSPVDIAAPVNSPDGEQPAVSDGREVRRQRLLTRYQALNEEQQLKFCDLHIDPQDLDAIETALFTVDPFSIHIPPAPTAKIPPNDSPEPPDEGWGVSQFDLLVLRERFDNLPDIAQLWTATLVAQGRNGNSWRITDRPTERRYQLYRGVLDLAEWGKGHDQLDDIIFAIIADIWGALPHNWPPGQLLSELDAEQAAHFAQIATDFTQDRYHIVYDVDGTLRLTATV